jgi:hypothetical protein
MKLLRLWQETKIKIKIMSTEVINITLRMKQIKVEIFTIEPIWKAIEGIDPKLNNISDNEKEAWLNKIHGVYEIRLLIE